MPRSKWRSEEEEVVSSDVPMEEAAGEEKKEEGEDGGDVERHAPPPKPMGGDERKIEYMVENPKTAGYKSWGRYELYKHARTVKQFLQLGGTRADFRWDLSHGFVRFVGASVAQEAAVQEQVEEKERELEELEAQRLRQLQEAERGDQPWLQASGLSRKHEGRSLRAKVERHLERVGTASRSAHCSNERAEKIREAVKEYAGHVCDFHRSRQEGGVAVPEGARGSTISSTTPPARSSTGTTHDHCWSWVAFFQEYQQ